MATNPEALQLSAATDSVPLSLRERWLRLRDRLLASPRFHRWAVRLPLTRPIARRRSRELFDLTAGFVYSQVLFACVQLRLLEQLAAGPRSQAELAQQLQLPEAGARRLLLAAASLRLVAPRGAGFGLGDLGAAMLGNPAIAAMVSHHAALYADLADPVALLRAEVPGQGTRLAAYWPYAADAATANPAAAEAGSYSQLMADSQALIAGDILASYSFSRHRLLLDVAGGQGAFASAVLQRWPGLRATVLDLPAVAERARARFADAGLAVRATAVGGNMFADELPRGADLISLVRVLHDHDDERALALLRAARAALEPGGRLLIAEPMAGTRGAEPAGDAYFGFYLFAMGSGRPRTAAELQAMARAAGFDRVRELATPRPLLVRLLLAEVTAAV